VKRLDDSTLEAIAELICGSGEGAGGGYDTPGPYRTMWQIREFFRRAGVQPQGRSSTRKWFTLESLQVVDGTGELQAVIVRLASPKEYQGDADTTATVTEHLNQILRVEGLQVVLNGVTPTLQETTASVSRPRPEDKPVESAPDFGLLNADTTLAEILSFRWEEAQRCVRGGAHLAAVVMMGSVLEGVLLHKAEQDPATAGRANSSPKDRAGKTKPIGDWSFSSLIDVAHEVGWLQGDVKRFSHALRDYRNLVHPYLQRQTGEYPDEDTCSICWQVVRAAISDLLGAD